MMQNEENPIQPEEEKLAAEMPDPAGPPQPERKGHPVLATLGVLGLGTAAAGLLLPLLVRTTATAGATRSAKIRWESRQAEIEAAFEDAERDERQEAATPTRENRTDECAGE